MKQTAPGKVVLLTTLIVASFAVTFVIVTVPKEKAPPSVPAEGELHETGPYSLTYEKVSKIYDELEHIRREALLVEQIQAVEIDKLAVFLEENPGSPLALLPIEEAAGWFATRENLVRYLKESHSAAVEFYDNFNELDSEWTNDIEYTEELAEMWGICREQQALYNFVTDHDERELQRWRNSEQSVPLWAELTSARPFMDRNLGDAPEVWRLIYLFDKEVADKIRSEGENADGGDDEGSMWDLFGELCNAGAPSFDAVWSILEPYYSK